MCTGNTIMAGRTLADPKKSLVDVLFYFIIIACFFGGAVLFHVVSLRCPQRAATYLGAVMAIVVTVCEVAQRYIVDVAVVGLEVVEIRNVYRWTVCGIAPLFGVVCAASTCGNLATTTTMISGHVLALSKIAVKWSHEGVDRDKCWITTSSIVVILFSVLGAAAGAAALYLTGGQTDWMFVPIAVLLALVLAAYDGLPKLHPDHIHIHESLFELCGADSETETAAAEEDQGYEIVKCESLV
eukprot:CAMPEP_0183583770 /NCGR_PEP_ID=MMETSP0371-20130417/152292_1 /TAXON_ID=268820 /ORGANISM="Peridinium aciculiferum, Strain PAER-2" /LENGTH=240 /DNA_ID=CAMNT_0025794645 /DNA_START=38 /DNA_END=760 /DNA_ORIENTATION=-